MSQSKYKKWLVNIFILILATILMLVIVEATMRWFDGYRLSTFELQQDPTNSQQTD